MFRRLHLSDKTQEALIRLLRAEVDSLRAESEALRGSIRYRLGDLMLQGLPLSFNSFRIIPRFFRVFLAYRRSILLGRPFGGSPSAVSVVPVPTLCCAQLIFDPTLPDSLVLNGVWQTNDEGLLVARLDALPPSYLELHALSENIARRLARLKSQGCRIECYADTPAHLVRYVQGVVRDNWDGEIP